MNWVCIMITRSADWLAMTGIAAAALILPGPWGSSGLEPSDLGPNADVTESILRGAALYREYDCVRCHTEPRTRHGVNIPPPLASAGSRCQPGWLVSYLLDPSPLRYRSEGVRPDLMMPPIPGGESEARDLSAFLSALRDSVSIPPLSWSEDELHDPQRRALGAELFKQYQCRGCHKLQGQGGQIGPALDAVGRRRRAEYVAALLRDPQGVIPGTAMDDKDLWDDEVEALTAHLLGLGENEGRPQP